MFDFIHFDLCSAAIAAAIGNVCFEVFRESVVLDSCGGAFDKQYTLIVIFLDYVLANDFCLGVTYELNATFAIGVNLVSLDKGV